MIPLLEIGARYLVNVGVCPIQPLHMHGSLTHITSTTMPFLVAHFPYLARRPLGDGHPSPRTFGNACPPPKGRRHILVARYLGRRNI